MSSIDPINSAMSYQAVNTNAAKPVQTDDAATSAAAKAVIQETNPVVDDTTAAVASTDEEAATEQGSQSDSGNEQIKKAVEQLNTKMLNQNSEAVFGIHEATNRVTIKIVDKDTKKVIKELPPEKTLDMLARIWEMAGILVDEKK